MLNLLRRLAEPPPAVGVTPADLVLQDNKVRLLRYRPSAAGVKFATPVLLVPSLINRHYVLDLAPGRSMAEWLVARGHDVYILDWGTPGDEDRFLTFDDYCDGYLGRALRRVARDAPGQKAHLLGYCMGGTLTAIHAAAHAEHLASLALIAAPIHFAHAGPLGTWVQTKGFDVQAMVDAFGNVPAQLMQSSFQMLRPTLPASKLMVLLDKQADNDFLDGFWALERWINDNVSFPGTCYVRYIQDLYRDDALYQGTFSLSGRAVKLSDIRCPTIAVTFADDHIVPEASSKPVLDLISSADKKHLSLRGGHVGAVVSRGASGNLWPALSQFWSERDAAPAKQSRAS